MLGGNYLAIKSLRILAKSFVPISLTSKFLHSFQPSLLKGILQLHYIVGKEYNTTGNIHYVMGSLYFTTGSLYFTTGSLHFTMGSLYFTTGCLYFTTGCPYFTTGSLHFTTGCLYFTTESFHFTMGSFHHACLAPFHLPFINQLLSTPEIT